MKLRPTHHEETTAAAGRRAPVGLVMRKSMGGECHNGPPPGESFGWAGVAKDAGAAGAFVTRDGAMCIKRFDAEQRSAEFIASTDAVDSHGDVIDQASWILNDYQANPVVLYGHNSRDLPIGKATAVGVINGKLMATIKFAPVEANPMAEQVWKLIEGGFLKAVSVGFQPTDGRYEVRDGEEVFVWRSPILKEISVVPVPANPEALARMKSALDAKAKAGEALIDKLKQAPVGTVQHPDFNTPAAPSGAQPETQGVPTMDKDTADKIEKQASAITTLEGDVKKQHERADKAEAHVRDLEGKLKAAETEKAAFEAQTKALAGERDAEKARADKLEGELIDAQVEALVGVKIKPTEKDVFVKLRKSDKSLFDQMIEQRGDMKLDKPVVKDVAPEGSANDDLLNELKSV